MITANVRELLKAVALGQTDAAHALNERLDASERSQLGMYGTAVLSVCLGHRFEADHSPETIRKFVNKMRANYAKADPPLKPFAVEGVIRAFAGEEHLLDEIPGEDQLASQYPIIREIVAESQELRERIDDVLHDADLLAAQWASEAAS